MRAIVQRVKSSSVTIDNKLVASISCGLNVLLGIKGDDTEKDMNYIIGKILNLRIFDDAEGKMNESVQDVMGEILIVSQFTLYGDCRKGRRPSYIRSGPVEQAEEKYHTFVRKFKDQTNLNVETGVFQADMEVSIVNDGPVTILLDSEKVF
ncbi:D-aminoacyl-tRNA deacylase [Eubacteriaceae bacterium ES3]|nr:D-aminoacyl-tRNA deacylase [Eubacteriaceae bacterium ES3]